MKKLILLLLLVACSPMTYTHGVPNLAKVDTGVWRSGQITTVDGWEYLKEVTHAKHLHVIKLNFDSEGSDDLAVEMGADVHYLPIEPAGDQGFWTDIADVFVRPDMSRVLLAVSLLMTASEDDVWLVHCTHGQDRTGFVVGVYRVMIDDWSKERAYDEMRAHHFHWELTGLVEAWEDFKP